LNEDFRQWILDKARNTPASEIVDDDKVVSRLLVDVLYGRSKSFNKDSRKNSNVAGGLSFLEQEYKRTVLSDEGGSDEHLS
jgi:hypothetical protein